MAELSAVPHGCTANRFRVDSLGQSGRPEEGRVGPLNYSDADQADLVPNGIVPEAAPFFDSGTVLT
jgi:hypothetical protein